METKYVKNEDSFGIEAYDDAKSKDQKSDPLNTSMRGSDLWPSKVSRHHHLVKMTRLGQRMSSPTVSAAPLTGKQSGRQLSEMLPNKALTKLRRCSTRYSKYCTPAAVFACCIWSRRAMSSSGFSLRLPVSRGIRS